MSHERRRNRRFPVESDLRVEVVGHSEWSLKLTDISIGGFGVVSANPFPSNAALRFRFADAARHWAVDLDARAVYFQLRANHGLYHTGFSFLDLDVDSVLGRAHELVGRAMRVLV